MGVEQNRKPLSKVARFGSLTTPSESVIRIVGAAFRNLSHDHHRTAAFIYTNLLPSIILPGWSERSNITNTGWKEKNSRAFGRKGIENKAKQSHGYFPNAQTVSTSDLKV